MKSRGFVAQRVVLMIADVLNITAAVIKGEDSFEKLGADMVDMAELSIALEQDLAIQIPDDLTDCKTVGQAIDLIYKLVNK
jgi:acyl carrier protein